MKKKKLNLNFDWKSKIIELLIVIVGISIPFQLDNWKESIKKDSKVKDYIASFHEENIANEARLISILKYSEIEIRNIDTLKQILLSKNYADKRIKNFTLKMLGQPVYSPTIITMENITASGEFELIKDIELRKKIISTYKSFQDASKLEGLLFEYSNDYLAPFLHKNVRYSDWSSIHSDFVKDPLFENIVITYNILLSQQLSGYQNTLEKIKLLNENLNTLSE